MAGYRWWKRAISNRRGEVIDAPHYLKGIVSPLERLPLYVRYGSRIEFAEPVQYTGDLIHARRLFVQFDEGYPGFNASELSKWIHLDGSSRTSPP